MRKRLLTYKENVYTVGDGMRFGRIWKTEINGSGTLGDAAIAERLDLMCSASNPMRIHHRLGIVLVAHNGRGFTASTSAGGEVAGLTPGLAFMKLLDKLSN